MEIRKILETERLCLRELQQSDYEDLRQMLQDQAVVYAYEHDFTDSDVQEWLNRQRMRYDRYGFGLWAAVVRESGEMIGQAGLTLQKYEGGDVLEIGYLLKRQYWKRGYGREAARACKSYAFDHLAAERVHSIIKSDNLPSIRVAEAVGMKRERSFTATYYNGPVLHYLYTVSRPRLR